MLSIQEFSRLGKRLKQLTQNQNKFMGNVDILFSGDFFNLNHKEHHYMIKSMKQLK